MQNDKEDITVFGYIFDTRKKTRTHIYQSSLNYEAMTAFRILDHFARARRSNLRKESRTRIWLITHLRVHSLVSCLSILDRANKLNPNVII